MAGKMVGQMARQMGISNEKAGNLMKKAKKANDGYNMGGMQSMRIPGMGGYEMNRGHGGTVMVVSIGSMSPKPYHREERSEASTLIQSTENQVRARHFNNNDGKVTF